MLHLYTLLHSSVYTPRLTHRSGKKKKDIKQRSFNRSWSRSGAKLTARPCLIHLNSQSDFPIWNPKVRLWALSCGLARGKLLNAASPNCVVITLSDTATAPDLIYNSWQPSDVGEAGGTAHLLSAIHPGAKLSQLFHPITKCKMLSYCCGSMINTAPGWIPDKSSAVEAEIQWKKTKKDSRAKENIHHRCILQSSVNGDNMEAPRAVSWCPDILSPATWLHHWVLCVAARARQLIGCLTIAHRISVPNNAKLRSIGTTLDNR